MLFVIPFLAVSAILIWVTIKGRDAFPFSHYPMFSNLADISQVEVFRIALETSDGDWHWWKSKFYRYPEFVGRRLQSFYYAEGDKREKIAIVLEKRRYLLNVVRLIQQEEGNMENLQSLRIVKRTVFKSADGKISVKDELIEEIPLAKILK